MKIPLLLLLISIISPSHSFDANSTELLFHNLVSSTVLPIKEKSRGYATYISSSTILFQNLYIWIFFDKFDGLTSQFTYFFFFLKANRYINNIYKISSNCERLCWEALLFLTNLMVWFSLAFPCWIESSVTTANRYWVNFSSIFSSQTFSLLM